MEACCEQSTLRFLDEEMWRSQSQHVIIPQRYQSKFFFLVIFSPVIERIMIEFGLNFTCIPSLRFKWTASPTRASSSHQQRGLGPEWLVSCVCLCALWIWRASERDVLNFGLWRLTEVQAVVDSVDTYGSLLDVQKLWFDSMEETDTVHGYESNRFSIHMCK